MAKKPSLKFEIGDWVVVYKESTLKHVSGRRKLIRTELPIPKCGQISGAKRAYEGKCVPRDYDEPGALTQRVAHLLWYVRYGVTNKPILVHEEDLLKTTSPGKLPRLKISNPFTEMPKESVAWRRDLRSYAEAQPRDENGRWIPALTTAGSESQESTEEPTQHPFELPENPPEHPATLIRNAEEFRNAFGEPNPLTQLRAGWLEIVNNPVLTDQYVNALTQNIELNTLPDNLHRRPIRDEYEW